MSTALRDSLTGAQRGPISMHTPGDFIVPTPPSARSQEAEWLDALYVTMCKLPLAEGEQAVAREIVRALASVLPEHSVGFSFGPAPDGTPQIVKFGGDRSDRAASRQQAGQSFERTVKVRGGPEGWALFVRSHDDAVLDDASTVSWVIDRAVLALRHGFEAAALCRRALEEQRQRQQLQSQVVQVEKLASLGQLAAGMVHELNNPLTSIVAYTDYLIRRLQTHGKGSDDELERLRRIGDSANRMLRFTKDLITYARPSSELAVPIAIHGIVDQALAFCEHVIAEAGAGVRRNYAEGLLPVMGMPEQLAQVFVNLVTNACHAMPRTGGQLTVSTTMSEDRSTVEISVTDNGHGIERHNVHNVFAPFFTTKVDGRGTGLGLSIVKNIVDNHGGEIHVVSEAPQGAKFVINLPVAAVSESQ